MSRKCFLAAFAAVLLIGVATNVKSDIAFYGDRDAYMQDADPSDWMFGTSFVPLEKKATGEDGLGFHKYAFEVLNVWVDEVVSGIAIAKDMSGWGGDLEYIPSGATVGLSHNTAHQGILSFSISLDQVFEEFINSFYIFVDPHDKSNGGTVTVTATAWDEEKESITMTGGGFFGFILDEGYFTDITVSIYGGKNNGGFSFDLGFGNGTISTVRDPGGGGQTVTPEPATLLILGFGAVGAGLAARRKMSRKS